MKRKLATMPYAQAHTVTYDDGTVILVSYTTVVATIDKNGWLYCYGLYSTTTRRHIGAFMKEFGKGATYHTVKACYNESKAYNIHNGRYMNIETGELLNL